MCIVPCMQCVDRNLGCHRSNTSSDLLMTWALLMLSQMNTQVKTNQIVQFIYANYTLIKLFLKWYFLWAIKNNFGKDFGGNRLFCHSMAWFRNAGVWWWYQKKRTGIYLVLFLLYNSLQTVLPFIACMGCRPLPLALGRPLLHPSFLARKWPIGSGLVSISFPCKGRDMHQTC